MSTLDASLLDRLFQLTVLFQSFSEAPICRGQIVPKFTDCAKEGGAELSIQTGRHC